MNKFITGIHHITALADNTQKNVDFYTGILGLRLVKKTINFDAPDVYHLYYGDQTGSPGSIMTFFPYEGIRQGRIGKGQVSVTAFSIPMQSLEYWMQRLDTYNIAYSQPQERFNEVFIYFEDYDGLGLELVANDQDLRPGFTYGQIPLEHAIRGFYGATLSVEGYERTAGLLMHIMEHKQLGEASNRFRYAAVASPGNYIDLLCAPDALRGLGGGGTVHHIAFATATDASQAEVREKILSAGYNVTPVLDRNYFHSIYFREPSGVLFEVATLPPGFAVDEPVESLGETLKLPEWEEHRRARLELALPPLNLHPLDYV